MLRGMNGHVTLGLLACSVALNGSPAAAQALDKGKEAASIESECGLKKGTITVVGDDIRLQPSQNEAYEKVDCALSRLSKANLGRIGFVGNEADLNAILKPPMRYIAEGSSTQMEALVKAAQAEKWVVSRIATASDGVVIVQFESGAKMTNGQATKLLDRIWKKEFGDIALGTAPRKISDPDSFGD